MSTEDPFDETSAAALLEKLTAEVLGFEGQR
jgi:hypothetical protein